MNLQTKIPLKSQQHNQIDYNAKIMLLGSCFSENIGEKFKYFKFQSSVNPFGILFQPLAIENLITRSINKDYYSEFDIHYHNEQWSCLDAHSKLNQASKVDLLKALNEQVDETYNQLITANHIIITLGTSWVYRYLETNKIVANCHKLPQKQFLKELLSVEQISESLEAIVSLARSINPKVSFLFTVSPVRHIKDGFVENTQSKSHLLAAIHQIVEPRNQLYYFPSYEIMMDELRDYRFYNTDMLHPNTVAIDYIWTQFKNVWISNSGQELMKTIDEIQRGLSHKPFSPNSEAHLKFLKALHLKIETLKDQYPNIIF
ncbi:GSCFA domain-containing protein [Winogradskyella bathintestinalis]|uniref:GSCFA domain-containing protein n=1 Tax=Winogradskyella bathintestinalis TaxID=3035208 RepID=A0ABT7ZYW0_9FLAO|nr:GSCFA domain-containing protein [Winogradskyella bathintestinalis]MDN3494081.1 GSCFA domain-containing protein [Winogradskyella bathintestinalis]